MIFGERNTKIKTITDFEIGKKIVYFYDKKFKLNLELLFNSKIRKEVNEGFCII